MKTVGIRQWVHRGTAGRDLRRSAAWMAVALLGVALSGCTGAGETPPVAYAQPEAVPAWRGVAPGTAYLGEDVLWRPREWLIFHMQDRQGTGFRLDFTVRDMNIYMQGPRPVMVWVVGPHGRTLARRIMEDDGVVSGNEQFRDGVYDVYQDYRYREWHRVHSPGGYPPGKRRSPYLDHPDKLPARRMSVEVPPGGAGLYRVAVVGSWDHWISMTPDRPIPTGIHPGPGPLHVEKGRFDEAYLYVPPTVKDLGISIAEEVQPYNWRVRLEDDRGRLLARTEPRTFMSYLVHKVQQGDRVYRLSVTGDSAGAHLHVVGVPFVLCPDAHTAALLRGGLSLDGKGRQSFHHVQRVLYGWAYGLTPRDLAVPAPPADLTPLSDPDMAKTIETLPETLAGQNMDPHSEDFGAFPVRATPDGLARLAAWDDPANPYYRNPALVRRVLLGRLHNVGNLSPFFWDIYNPDAPHSFAVNPHRITSLPFRSNWNSFATGARQHWLSAIPLRDIAPEVLPAEVYDAWTQWLNSLVYGRGMMHVGEMVNQWLYSLTHKMYIYEFTGNPEIPELVNRHLDHILTPGVMGRLNPDPTPYRSALGYGQSADSGWVGAGYMAEAKGFDGAYSAWCQENGLHRLWTRLGNPRIIDYLKQYNTLKSHLAMPKHGRPTQDAWREITAPCDFNFRTRSHPFSPTFARALPIEVVRSIPYGDLWVADDDRAPERPWPCLEEKPFVRVMDNKFFFINTGAYYSINYGGHVLPDWSFFTWGKVENGSASLVGYDGFGSRGGLGRKPTKPGGLSALFVRNCGPVIQAQNHDVTYTHAVWGRRRTPIVQECNPADVDPTVVSAAYVDARTEFFEQSRIFRRSGAFTYAPLHFTRTLHYRDDRVMVELELLATGEVDLAELYDCLPYHADNRTVRVYDDGFNLAGEFDPLKHDDDGPIELRAVTFTGGHGAGAAIVFDRAYRATQAPVLRYRDLASATRSFNLELPGRIDEGKTVRVRYAIVPFQKPPSREDLRRIAEQENLR